MKSDYLLLIVKLVRLNTAYSHIPLRCSAKTFRHGISCLHMRNIHQTQPFLILTCLIVYSKKSFEDSGLHYVIHSSPLYDRD